MTIPAGSWVEENQRYLSAELACLHAFLDAQINKVEKREAAESLVLAEQMSVPPALDTLCRNFGLSKFERNILLLCAGMELDSHFINLCADINGQKYPYPIFSMALSLFQDAHWSALTPSAPLRYWHLVHLEQNPSVTQARLQIDEQVLHYLAGTPHMDERLSKYVLPVAHSQTVVPSHRDLAGTVARVWSQSVDHNLPIIHLTGNDATEVRHIAVEVSSLLGLELYRMSTHALPVGVAEMDTLCRLWDREAILGKLVLLLESYSDEPAQEVILNDFISRLESPLIVAGGEPVRNANRPVVRFDVARPTHLEQQAVWKDALGAHAGRLNGRIETIVSHFNLDAASITRISAGALFNVPKNPDQLAKNLWDACLNETRPRLGELAQRIPPMSTWGELVLPGTQHDTLRELAIHVRQRLKVYEVWGFAAKSARGLGISALFSGPSGTGKTMAAEVLANELDLDLYRIDLSQVVSKYIGETEKNLRRIFDAADVGGAILLFDEADALFGKRSEVKDSHDRYANVEVSYLLQRMESYRGLAILTTNFRDALDQAFLRRIRFVVNFPFPDAMQRMEIWRHIFPTQTPIQALDFERLARLNVAGGNIRNIAMQAAFLAADADEPVQMEHLLRAARTEYAKLERPLSEAEIGGWV